MGRNSLDEKDVTPTTEITSPHTPTAKTPVNDNTITHQVLITPNIPLDGPSDLPISPPNASKPKIVRPIPPDSLGFPLIIRHHEPGPGSANDAGSPFRSNCDAKPHISERSPPSGGTDHPTPRCGGDKNDSLGSIDLVAETPVATAPEVETPSDQGDEDVDTSSKLLPGKEASTSQSHVRSGSASSIFTAPETPLRKKGIQVMNLNLNAKSPSANTNMSTTPSEAGGLTDLEYDDYDLQVNSMIRGTIFKINSN
jgi:hypothetical protein